MRLEPFKLERILSEWQNQVELDLSMSGVDAMELHELVSADELAELHRSTKLRYIQTNGPVPLRQAIIRRYPGADVDNVLVTNGSSEALMLLLWRWCEPDFEIVELTPTYSLVGGLARTFGAQVKQVPYVRERGWAPDLVALERTVTGATNMIYVCNPNNPTGVILSDAEMEAVVRIAERVGAWIVADEIYHGAVLDGRPTRSFWGMYDRVLLTAGLSKAYGLGGLRVGWLVGPRTEVQQIWHYRDYTTTTTTALSAALAGLALEPERERRIFERTRRIAQQNISLLHQWISQFPELLHVVPTQIAGLALIGYTLPIPSEELAKSLIQTDALLVAPGSYFGVESHVRIGYSVPHFARALERLAPAFERLAASV